jgi:hypothetical protein
MWYKVTINSYVVQSNHNQLCGAKIHKRVMRSTPNQLCGAKNVNKCAVQSNRDQLFGAKKKVNKCVVQSNHRRKKNRTSYVVQRNLNQLCGAK